MRPITQLLAEYNRGKFAEELTEAVHRLIGDVTATGKKGSLAIKIEFKPAKGGSPALLLGMDFVDKSPEFDRPAEYMYVTADHDLVRNDPMQGQLHLQAVPKAAPMPDFDPATGEVRSTVAAPQPLNPQQQQAS